MAHVNRVLHYATPDRDGTLAAACGRRILTSVVLTPFPNFVECKDCLKWLDAVLPPITKLIPETT